MFYEIWLQHIKVTSPKCDYEHDYKMCLWSDHETWFWNVISKHECEIWLWNMIRDMIMKYDYEIWLNEIHHEIRAWNMIIKCGVCMITVLAKW